MTIAMITARGGSTRTPNKNGKLFCGIPLLGWSVIQAVNTPNIDEVFLTTDSEEYALIGSHFGANVIMRPIWDNGVTAGVPFLHALKRIEEMGIYPDDIVSMLPTSPLKKPGQMAQMVEAFHELNIDEMTTGAPIKETFVLKNELGSYWDRFREENLGDSYQAKMIIADKFWKYTRMCGGWGIAKRDYLYNAWSTQPSLDIEIDTKPVDTEKVWNIFAVEDWQCFEIDYPDDFLLCESLMEKFILKGNGPEVYGDNIPQEFLVEKAANKKYGNQFQQ